MDYQQADQFLELRNIGVDYNSKVGIMSFYTTLEQSVDVTLLVQTNEGELKDYWKVDHEEEMEAVVIKYSKEPMYISLDDITDIVEPIYTEYNEETETEIINKENVNKKINETRFLPEKF